MNAVSPLSSGAAIAAHARPAVQTARPGVGAADSAPRGPAVVLGGGLVPVSAIQDPGAIGGSPDVSPVPPVKPVVYRPGAAVNLSV